MKKENCIQASKEILKMFSILNISSCDGITVLVSLLIRVCRIINLSKPNLLNVISESWENDENQISNEDIKKVINDCVLIKKNNKTS